MYENKFPEVDDLVMVNVVQIADMGAYVHLLEYNNTEGMILLSELSRRRIRSIQKLIRVGRNEVVVVLRVDTEKGYIDLSKRRVSAEDIQKCEEKFTKSKTVHSIMRHVAEKQYKTYGKSLEDLYVQIGWPLYRKYGHAYDAFKAAIYEPDKVFEGLEIEPEIRAELLKNIKRRMTPQPIKLRGDIELTCFGYAGIDAIKESLKIGEACSIKLVAPPLYVMTAHATDKALGIETLEKAIAAIEENIKKYNGSLTVKMSPRAVSESDELELQKLLDRAERENAEVSADEDDDSD
ncbi:hypothetical protein LY90DRAFT_523066 [Neocallimastix californiae]|uniref:S1 motif domain-containing protein n=1 Tax=Neocallimastix californiae TaxID=1754190 RepID=A0A1Y2DRT3_9FUNG|nr:hypothetical protein LY90DRAFT_523066 [Neocallimastix californiae]|eukprot:ORY61978.1 hypothetical protein LY90DRAFT_523066 [Neocallimastix californiae]